MIQYTQDNIQQEFALSDAVFESLKTHHNLLIKWQKTINLVGNKTLADAWHRHFADSAQLSRLIPEDDDKRVYVDLGCGGGFPGLVIAMMRPELDVHLVESGERKGQFMRTVIREAGVRNASVHTRRIEDIMGEFTPDYISARALAPLLKLLDYCRPWIVANPALRFYFLKGERAGEELKEAREAYNFDLSTIPSMTDKRAQIQLLGQVKNRL